MTTPQPAPLSGWTSVCRPDGEGTLDMTATEPLDVLDAIDVPVVVIRRAFTVACYNKAAALVLDLVPSHIDKSPHDIPALAGVAGLEEGCAETVAGGMARRLDFRHGDKTFVVRIAPCTRAQALVSGTVLTLTNVTAFRASIDQAVYEREYTKAILNTVSDPLVVLSADQKVKSGNRAFYAMFRVSRDDRGVSLYEIANGAFDCPRLRTQMDALLAGSTTFKPVEVEHLFPELGQRTLCLDARPLTVPGQSGRTILLTFQDITAHKEAERSNARLAAIVESSDDAIVGTTLDGIITSWNRGAQRIFGYAAAEVIGKPVTLLIPEERQAEEPVVVERLRRGERVQHYDTLRRRQDGQVFEASVTVSPVTDTAGQIIALSRIGRDISDRKRVENNLSDFFENASVPLHWVGPDGIILRANRRELDLLGYRHDEYVGRHISEFHVHQEIIADILKRLSNGEIINGREAQLRCKDGSIRDVVIDSSVLWENGRFIHTRCFTIDITARKAAEQGQRMLIEELQHRVKNTLATAQALALQTLHGATAAERQAFAARIQSLSNAHNVLTRDNWERAPLGDVVNGALGPFQKERIAIAGPHVLLDAGKALRMTMVLHELATNAVKYGALSNATGSIRIDWTLREVGGCPGLQLCWEERGGPPVRVPSQKGFGSRLIEAGLEESHVVFAPDGMRCTLQMQL